MTHEMVVTEKLLAGIGRIPPLKPAIVAMLQEINGGDYTINRLKQLIEEDANTSATILKIANSPFYGLHGKIASIRDACVMLGRNSLCNIVYATALESYSGCMEHHPARLSLSRHTQATAIVAGRIARHVQLEAGTAYTLGLLHELGKQIAMVGFPDFFNAFVQAAARIPEETWQELAAMSLLGERIAQKWHLPELFQHCIRHVVSPQECPVQTRRYVVLVAASHWLATDLGFPSPGEPQDLDARRAALQLLNCGELPLLAADTLQEVDADLKSLLQTHL